MILTRTEAASSAPLYLALHLQSASLQAGLGDGFQILLSDLGIPLDKTDSAAEFLQALRQVLEKTQMIAADLASPLLAAGLAVPAHVHPTTGSLTLPTAPQAMWQGMDVRAWLAHELGLPVVVESDVIATAVAELKVGAARGANDVLIVKIDTEVQAAYWRNGEFVRGARGCFGNLGHLATGNSDLPCSCGHLGCLEASVATDAILDRFYAAAEAAELELEDDEMPESAEAVFALSQKQHAIAVAVLDDVTFDLGTGIASAVNLLNPQKVVITGAPLYLRSEFFQQLARDASRRMLPACAAAVQLVPGMIREHPECLGAMLLARERFG
ncbi:MAG: ROK family protein [candidate division KSB1 bacterium]|nr:ROK family protein [candidate division KSB1 bacterium]MDZ7276335.1 ROK family protein [candidate division KSB1 bacterium]MDZ7287712.1 ROK family protein [candidate division KSB1 bacterium]MDZ7299948.1 ROK family protein [candidate division KSB1 bacterium]MDZ7305723.1 ROK family protein [candidate division KSB1 bacterium]